MCKWLKVLPVLFFLLFLANSAFAQGSLIKDIAWRYTPSGVFPAPGATITVCTSSATGSPCTPKISLFSDAALTQPVSNPLPVCSSSPQFGCIDGLGNWSAYVSPGAYTYSASGAGLLAYGPVPISASVVSGGPASFSSLSVSGAATFTGIMTCTIVNMVRCISPSNPQGWTGSDAGAWINAANANCVSSGTGCPIQIAAGSYSFSTPIVVTQSSDISCPGGPDATVLTYTPATGIALTANTNGTSFGLHGCKLTTSTSATSQGVVVKLGNQVDIARNHIAGFLRGGISVTGDSVSGHSLGVRIHENLIDGYCGSGSYAYSLDHAVDVTFSNNEAYSTTDCATATASMIIDTGAGGIWATSSTHEQGISGLIVRNTNQGGAYGGAPGAIWFVGYTVADTNPGGTGVVLDGTLGTTPTNFFCIGCWVKGAGLNNANSVITSTAIGVDVEGGSHIHWSGGNILTSASWAVKINTSGEDVTFDSVDAVGNNQGNTASVGGFLVTANPQNWALRGNSSGNSAAYGGHQFYGADTSATTLAQAGIISGNDFKSNTSLRIKLPTALGTQNVDAPEFGGLSGIAILGGAMFVGGTLPAGVTASAVCGSDASAGYALKCSTNNGPFTPLAGIFTSVNVAPVTANTNTAADQNGMAITVTAGALNSISRTLLIQLAGVYSTPAASTSVITDKLKLCTVSGCGSGTVITLATWTTTALGGIQATNDPFNCVLNATTQTAGASAAFEAHGNLTIDLAALSTAAESVFADGNTATIGTIDSTVQLFLQHTKAFSNASASNSFTDRQMIADTVN